jgi:hypothetical protein
VRAHAATISSFFILDSVWRILKVPKQFGAIGHIVLMVFLYQKLSMFPKLKIGNFRMSDPDWNALEAHFAERRIPTGTGVRMILIEYLKKQGVLK